MSSPSRRYDAVFLDMGFTLVNLHSGFEQELLGFTQRAGLDITLQDVRAGLSAFWEDWTLTDATRTWTPSAAHDAEVSFEMDREVCLRLGLTDPAIHSAVHRRARHLYGDLAAYSLFPEVPATLDALRAAVPTLGILSNWDWGLPDLCDRLGLTPYFDVIVVSARVGAAKPNPRIFQHALAAAGSTPDRTLHIGDSLEADVRGAQGVGITGVLIDRPGAVPDGDFPCVRRLDEVLALL
jgi:putative hydrolase of the HAD superfamily